MIIDPRGMNVVEWTAQMNLDLDRFGVVSLLASPQDWRMWAANVCSFQALQLAQIPDPFDFDNWQDWAIRFCQTVGNIV